MLSWHRGWQRSQRPRQPKSHSSRLCPLCPLLHCRGTQQAPQHRPQRQMQLERGYLQLRVPFQPQCQLAMVWERAVGAVVGRSRRRLRRLRWSC
jgi:hypothetical protein